MLVEVYVADSGAIAVVAKGGRQLLPKDHGIWGHLKDLEVDIADKGLTGIDVKTCIHDIESRGVHIAPVKISV